MSASPARSIAKVEAYKNLNDEHRCKVTLESGEVVALADLSRAELIRAAKIAFPEVSGKAWFKVTTGVLSRAIRTNTVPEDLDTTGKSIGKSSTESHQDEAQAEPKAEPTVKEKAAKVATAGSAEALAEAIANLIPPAPTVDESTVQRLVEQHVKHVLTEAPVVRHEIVGHTTKALPEQAHKALPEIVVILSRPERHLFLVGPAGSGKSTLAEQAAAAITTEAHPDGLPFHAASYGPTTPTSKFLGYNDATGNFIGTPFEDAWTNGGVFLGDELDNGHPGLVAELNQALSNGYCAFANGLRKAHKDFRYVATGNTFGKGPDRLFVGRNILDAATLDRFVTVEVDYDERLERNLALAYATDETVDAIRTFVSLVQSVRKSVLKAGLSLVVSPRASITGASLIADGFTPERAAEIRLHAGWTAEQKAKVGL